jgi:transcriptional regulator with XRE-family HTH domain
MEEKLMPKRISSGEKMRKYRGVRSQKEVAEALGISLSSYVKYERNERRPSDSVKCRIARYYGKSVESIFFA